MQTGWQEYVFPPVIEAVLAVEFESTIDLGIIKLIELANAWSQEFPILSEHPPIPPTRPFAQGPGFVLDIGTTTTQIRLVLAQQDQHLLVQLQNDRLVLNWRKLTGDGASYIGYSSMLKTFDALLVDLKSRAFGDSPPPAALVTEWAYVNRLPSSALVGVDPFNAWSDSVISDQTAPLLTRFQHVRRFIPGGGAEGQVSVSAEPEIATNPEVVDLTISARCFHEPDTTLSIALERSRTAHDIARRALDGVTTAEAKIMWGVR